MKEAFSAIDSAIGDLDSCRRFLRRKQAQRVNASSEKAQVKATGFAWFNNHRKLLLSYLRAASIEDLDSNYEQLISSTDRSTLRSRYLTIIKETRNLLSGLRAAVVSHQATQPSPVGSSDQPPDISALVPDPSVQDAIVRRWIECTRCIEAGAPMAAVVMMGGLVEAFLLARVNRETNKAQIFTANKAPKDSKTNKTLPLKKWALRNFIDVAHEIGWLSRSARDVSEVLRDYRNYIHPYKELSHGVALGIGDARVIWEVAKSITYQVLSSI
jgi:hypothetical protein